MYGNGRDAIMVDKCARDLQGEAKRMKSRLDANGNFIEALEGFANCDAIYQIDDNGDRKTIFAIYGDLKMKHPEMEKEYDHLLELIEKEG